MSNVCLASRGLVDIAKSFTNTTGMKFKESEIWGNPESLFNYNGTNNQNNNNIKTGGIEMATAKWNVENNLNGGVQPIPTTGVQTGAANNIANLWTAATMAGNRTAVGGNMGTTQVQQVQPTVGVMGQTQSASGLAPGWSAVGTTGTTVVNNGMVNTATVPASKAEVAKEAVKKLAGKLLELSRTLNPEEFNELVKLFDLADIKDEFVSKSGRQDIYLGRELLTNAINEMATVLNETEQKNATVANKLNQIVTVFNTSGDYDAANIYNLVLESIKTGAIPADIQKDPNKKSLNRVCQMAINFVSGGNNSSVQWGSSAATGVNWGTNNQVGWGNNTQQGWGNNQSQGWGASNWNTNQSQGWGGNTSWTNNNQQQTGWGSTNWGLNNNQQSGWVNNNPIQTSSNWVTMPSGNQSQVQTNPVNTNWGNNQQAGWGNSYSNTWGNNVVAGNQPTEGWGLSNTQPAGGWNQQPQTTNWGNMNNYTQQTGAWNGNNGGYDWNATTNNYGQAPMNNNWNNNQQQQGWNANITGTMMTSDGRYDWNAITNMANAVQAQQGYTNVMNNNQNNPKTYGQSYVKNGNTMCYL